MSDLRRTLRTVVVAGPLISSGTVVLIGRTLIIGPRLGDGTLAVAARIAVRRTPVVAGARSGLCSVPIITAAVVSSAGIGDGAYHCSAKQEDTCTSQ